MSSLEFTLRGERPPEDSEPEEGRRHPTWRVALVALAAAVVALYTRDQWAAVAEVVPPEDFGEHAVGESAGFQRAVVRNGGRAPLRIDSAVVLGEERAFAVLEDQCSRSTLARDARCAVSIEFTPRHPGAHFARLRLEGNAANGSQELLLSGAGATPPLIAKARVEPSAIDAATPIGESLEVPVTVSSIGNGALRLFLIALDSDPASFTVDDSGCQNKELQPGDTCTFTVRFTPPSEGDHLARLVIYNDSREGPLMMNLRGKGAAATVDGGPVPVHKPPATLPVENPPPPRDEPPPPPRPIRPGGRSAADSENVYPCERIVAEWEPVKDDSGPVTYAVRLEQRSGPPDDPGAGDWHGVSQIPCGDDAQCDMTGPLGELLSSLRRFAGVRETYVRRGATAANPRAMKPTSVQPAWVRAPEFRWSVRALDHAGQSSAPSEPRYFRCIREALVQ